MNTLIIAAAVFAGSLLSGGIGYLKSGEPFIFKKYLLSVLSGIGGAVAFALAYQFTASGVTIYNILAAFLAGMGVASGVSGSISAVRSMRAGKVGR